MSTLKKIARSTILALVLLGSVAGGVQFFTHSNVTVADTGGNDNLDAG